MSENKAIKDPSQETWYVEKYALENNDIGWYQVGDLEEGEQQSLVYYLLNDFYGMAEENTLSEIIRHRPSLLDFYRKDLLSDLEMIEEIIGTNMDNWWNLARNATNEEVDIILTHYADAPEEVIRLLFGADTPYALEKLAELSKDSGDVIEIARELHMILHEDGSFERRYLKEEYDLFNAKSDSGPLPEGINLLTNSETAVRDGKVATCSNRIQSLLTCDYTKLAPFRGTVLEKIGSYHFFSSNCESCDTWLNNNAFKIVPEQPWEFIGTYRTYDEVGLETDIDEDDVDCHPESAEPLDDDQPEYLLYASNNVSKEGNKRIATLGGRPYWVQSPEIPDCPECNKMMFYVGRNQASQWSGSIGDQVVFGFACEDCMLAVQIMQCT